MLDFILNKLSSASGPDTPTSLRREARFIYIDTYILILGLFSLVLGFKIGIVFLALVHFLLSALTAKNKLVWMVLTPLFLSLQVGLLLLICSLLEGRDSSAGILGQYAVSNDRAAFVSATIITFGLIGQLFTLGGVIVDHAEHRIKEQFPM